MNEKEEKSDLVMASAESIRAALRVDAVLAAEHGFEDNHPEADRRRIKRAGNQARKRFQRQR